MSCSDETKIDKRRLVVDKNLNESVNRKPVFVHYVNETNPSAKEAQNFKIFLEYASKIDHPTADIFIESLNFDLKNHSKVMNEERKELLKLFEKPIVSDFGVFLISNESFKNNYAYVKKESQKFKKVNLDLNKTVFNNETQKSNPLSTEKGLKIVWHKIFNQFNPKKHKYIWVIRSHGSALYLINPKLNIWHEDWSAKSLGINFKYNEKIPKHLHQSGITRDNFFNIVSEFTSKNEAIFPIISFESCSSEIQKSYIDKYNINKLGSIFYTLASDFVPYRFMDYESVFEEMEKNNLSFEVAFSKILFAHKFEPLVEIKRIEFWMVFLPLMILLIIIINVYLDTKRLKTKS